MNLVRNLAIASLIRLAVCHRDGSLGILFEGGSTAACRALRSSAYIGAMSGAGSESLPVIWSRQR